jgi:hypothetical protein
MAQVVECLPTKVQAPELWERKVQAPEKERDRERERKRERERTQNKQNLKSEILSKK